jgi:hypothetical protein
VAIPFGRIPSMEARLMIRPPLAGLGHDRTRGLGIQEGPLEVDIDHLVPEVLGHIQHRHEGEDARIVDQDVKATKGIHGRLNDLMGIPGTARVGGNRLGGPALRPDPFNGFVCSLQVDVRDHDTAPCLCQTEGDRLADTSSTARDNGTLSGEVKELFDRRK